MYIARLDISWRRCGTSASAPAKAHPKLAANLDMGSYRKPGRESEREREREGERERERERRQRIAGPTAVRLSEAPLPGERERERDSPP